MRINRFLAGGYLAGGIVNIIAIITANEWRSSLIINVVMIVFCMVLMLYEIFTEFDYYFEEVADAIGKSE